MTAYEQSRPSCGWAGMGLLTGWQVRGRLTCLMSHNIFCNEKHELWRQNDCRRWRRKRADRGLIIRKAAEWTRQEHVCRGPRLSLYHHGTARVCILNTFYTATTDFPNLTRNNTPSDAGRHVGTWIAQKKGSAVEKGGKRYECRTTWSPIIHCLPQGYQVLLTDVSRRLGRRRPTIAYCMLSSCSLWLSLYTRYVAFLRVQA